MTNPADPWMSHDFIEEIPREVVLDGKKYLLLLCWACGREFATRPHEANWEAVSAARVRYEFLDDDVSERWLREACPGRTLPSDEVDRKITRTR